LFSQPINNILSASKSEYSRGIFIVTDAQGPQDEACGIDRLYVFRQDDRNDLVGV
jgi:hypothetical protein